MKAHVEPPQNEISLYEMNKLLVPGAAELDPLDRDVAKKNLKDWVESFSNSKHFLLYGKNIGYFTLFEHLEPYDKTQIFEELVFECLDDVADKIYSVDLNEDNVFEIWIGYHGTPEVLYLFNYELGVVYFG